MPAGKELVIHPGEWYFGEDYCCIRTLLGSCVAITVWHPRLHLGGMCHYLLPRALMPTDKRELDPRYGVDALQLMRTAMEKQARPSEYQLGFFGGGDMFGGRIKSRVGEANIELAVRWLAENHLPLKHQDTGGFVSRSIALDLKSGMVNVRQIEPDLQPGGYP